MSAVCQTPMTIAAYKSLPKKSVPNRYLKLGGCFGLTEPDFGSHAVGMRTRAVRRDGSWILNGTKRWITNGSLSKVAVVWAQTEEGVRGFLVEPGMPGYETRDIKGKFSLRGSVTSELFFNDVEVPESSRLPKAEGMKGPLSCLTQARFGISRYYRARYRC